VAFSRDARPRQADLEALFPDVGVVAVSVDWTMDELRALQERVAQEFGGSDGVSSGILVTHGVVSVGFGVLTEERVASVVDAFAGERICVEGADPAGAPADGSQQTSGDGWRLLADEPEVGDVYRTGLATDEASYRALWADIGLTGPRPDVDFDAEIVIWFGAVYGSSCPNLRLDDVVVKRERALVHAEIVLVDRPSACTADATRAPMWWRWIGRPFQRDRSRSSSVPRTHRPARQRNASGSTPTSPSPERLPLRTTSATTQRRPSRKRCAAATPSSPAIRSPSGWMCAAASSGSGCSTMLAGGLRSPPAPSSTFPSPGERKSPTACSRSRSR